MKKVVAWIVLAVSSIGSLGVLMMLLVGDEKPNPLVALFWFGLLFISAGFVNKYRGRK